VAGDGQAATAFTLGRPDIETVGGQAVREQPHQLARLVAAGV
jgi:hypothetical protein